MESPFARFITRPWGTWQAIGYGTLAVGLFDAIDAIVFFGLRSGATPMRIFQSIASGLIGRDAYAGGAGTALVGLVLHFVVAFGIVSTYMLASGIQPALTRRPLLYGAVYGVVAYLVMNLVVIPLSAIGTVRFSTPGVINGLLIHAALVGPPSALAAARAAAGWRAAPPRAR